MTTTGIVFKQKELRCIMESSGYAQEDKVRELSWR